MLFCRKDVPGAGFPWLQLGGVGDGTPEMAADASSFSA